MAMTCGEATMRLLARYGVTTAFGIPGVHTLDLCRGLTGGGNAGAITHIQARNEQAAGFMAEGWARATGQVGVAIVISGPGVTNASTALGQCYADSLPMLLISAEPQTESLGKGWGVLHEITEQRRVTEPLCAFSATAMRAADVPELMARAFTLFASARPRPVHISIPVDVQAEVVEELWEPVPLPPRPAPDLGLVAQAAKMLLAAERPAILLGGGATGTAGDMTAIADRLGAVVACSTAGKGIVAEDHPLSLGGYRVREDGLDLLARADVVLAVGTELAETDSFTGTLRLPGQVIRVDLDPTKFTDLYPAALAIQADAGATMAALRSALGTGAPPAGRREEAARQVAAVKAAVSAKLTEKERRHSRLLDLLARAAPEGTVWSGDPCQPVYTGAFAMTVRQPRRWFYPVGFCTLGTALPAAIGAKLARPDAPVVVLSGDGGFMFSAAELLTAAEARLPLPIILWDNHGLQQIGDDMDRRGIERVGVDGIRPDFALLARACHCLAEEPQSAEDLARALTEALTADRPTLIRVREDADWLA